MSKFKHKEPKTLKELRQVFIQFLKYHNLLNSYESFLKRFYRMELEQSLDQDDKRIKEGLNTSYISHTTVLNNNQEKEWKEIHNKFMSKK